MTTSVKNTNDNGLYLSEENSFFLPQGIKNIDYQLIDSTYLNYKEILDFLQNYSKFEKKSNHFLNIVMAKIKDDSNIQILESPENNSEYNRLVPPYNTQCYNLNKGCTKMAAFKSTISKNCYCWFHVNCQNVDN